MAGQVDRSCSWRSRFRLACVDGLAYRCSGIPDDVGRQHGELPMMDEFNLLLIQYGLIGFIIIYIAAGLVILALGIEFLGWVVLGRSLILKWWIK